MGLLTSDIDMFSAYNGAPMRGSSKYNEPDRILHN